MSEKRFTIHKESKYKEEWYAYPFCIKEDGEVILETIPLSIAEKIRDKLNEQQATINKQDDEIKKLKRTERSWRKIHCCNKESNNCGIVIEQQATITNLQGDVERLKYIIEELRKDNYNKFELINKMKKEEKLYAKEILRLNELNKQTSEFTDILGGY